MGIQIKLLLLTMMVILLSACDNESAQSKIENPLAGHTKALEKAKEMENKLLEAQQKTQDSIDKATN